MKYAEMKQLCIKLECFETPEWPIKAILNKEILTQIVLDPCCGPGIMAHLAKMKGYDVLASDIHNWGYHDTKVVDFLRVENGPPAPFTVLMNPPFSKATQFVEKAFEIGAKKVVMFQRFAFWESAGREDFWRRFPPSRVYICRDRASCFRFDLPRREDGKRFDPETGKVLHDSPTAHAWFVFEPGHPVGTVLGHISRKDAEE